MKIGATTKEHDLLNPLNKGPLVSENTSFDLAPTFSPFSLKTNRTLIILTATIRIPACSSIRVFNQNARYNNYNNYMLFLCLSEQADMLPILCQMCAYIKHKLLPHPPPPKSSDLKADSSLIAELFPAEQVRSNTEGGNGTTSNKLEFSHPLNKFKVNATTTTKKMQYKLFYLNVHVSFKETKVQLERFFY